MAEKTYRILVINPGSTSTKVGVFDGEAEVFTKNVAHEASKLAEFKSVSDQMPYRRDLILEVLEENGVALDTIDAFVGRGGGLLSVVGGTYQVNDVLLDHAYRGANGIQHPAQLGSQLANAFAVQVGKPAFVVNPPDTDEFCDYARVTGIKGIYRNSHLHAQPQGDRDPPRGVPRRQVRGLQLRRVPPGRRRLGVRPSPRQDGRRLRHRRRRGPHGPDPLRRGARLRDRGLAG